MVTERSTSENFLAPIQDLLLQVEARMRSQAEGYFSELGIALNHLLSSGGKRIRPAVALLCGRMLGCASELLIPLATSIELLHTATLVHDDLIDGAFLRRGIATLNSRWSAAATVLTGDFIFAQAAKTVAETNSVPVIKLFSQTLATIVNGELTQFFSERGIADLDHYNRRIYAKTASLFESSAKAAALLSNATDTIVESLTKYGYSIGMAFQVVDDVLDYTGEQAALGKPIASDLRNGLITLPALYYLSQYPDDPDIHSLVNDAFVEESTINRLVNAIRESGAIHQAMNDARSYINRGLESLQEMPDNTERWSLQALARFIVDRRV